jgi:hypothetical protein
MSGPRRTIQGSGNEITTPTHAPCPTCRAGANPVEHGDRMETDQNLAPCSNSVDVDRRTTESAEGGVRGICNSEMPENAGARKALTIFANELGHFLPESADLKGQKIRQGSTTMS